MKKILLNLVLICSVATSFTSCVTTNKGFQSSPVISRNVQLDPIKADIKVNETEKISGESISTYFLFFRISGDNTFADGINYSTDAGGSRLRLYNPMKKARLNKVRSAAAYKALSTVDYDFGEYDFLVHPNYSVTTKNYLGIVKVYECKVSGYGAKYKNFRSDK